MKNYSEILRRCPLFNGISDENMMTMLNCLGAKVEFFDKKYTIIAEGNTARHIGIMLSGSAHIEQSDFYGNRTILNTVGASQVFGEAFACADIESMPVSVTANEPCEVMLIDKQHILHTCNNNCDFHQKLIFNMMKNLAEKTIMMHQKIEITSKRTTRDKLMAYLITESKKAKSNSFDISFNRQELADYLEVDRSGLSTEIGKLCNEGVIKSNRKHFEIL